MSFVAFIVALTPLLCTHQTCGEIWTKDERNNKSYKIFLDKLNWPESQSSCKQNNANLASITSRREQTFLKDLVGKINDLGVWIGASDIKNEGVWTWSDGQPWFNGIEWSKNQPDDWKTVEDCGMLKTNLQTGTLNDLDCNRRISYMCMRTDCYKPMTTGYLYTGGPAITYGDMYNVACAKGYTGTASPTIVSCEASGSWTSVSGCTIVDCYKPMTTGYLYTGGPATTYGETYNVVCETGYTGTASPTTVSCEASGNWTLVSGCTIVDCYKPMTTGYLYTGGPATTYGETYEVVCETGYTGKASLANVSCEANGNWTLVSGCSIADCYKPMTTGYLYTGGPATTYGETYNVVCATGYTGLASPTTVACEANGSWTSVSGCTVADCYKPMTTGYLYTGGPATTYGETYNVVCATGYTGLASPTTVACEANGSWTSVSGCTVADCYKPMTTGYLYTGGPATTYGETYNVVCATGYTGLASPTTVACEANGSWTSVSGCTVADSMINKSKQRFPDGLIVTVAVASLIATELTVVVAIFLFERRKRNSKKSKKIPTGVQCAEFDSGLRNQETGDVNDTIDAAGDATYMNVSTKERRLNAKESNSYEMLIINETSDDSVYEEFNFEQSSANQIFDSEQRWKRFNMKW